MRDDRSIDDKTFFIVYFFLVINDIVSAITLPKTL